MLWINLERGINNFKKMKSIYYVIRRKEETKVNFR